MKIREADARRFNDFSRAEPETSIYQTSYWSDYMAEKGYRPSFIEAVNDENLVLGLGMYLAKKESFLSNKFSAVVPHGFLINYYDEDLYRAFHQQLLIYLNEHKITSLLIEPPINEDDILAEKMLKDLGYQKIEDKIIYEEDVNTHVNAISDPNIILKIRCERDEKALETICSGKADKEKLNIFRHLKGHAAVYVARLDTVKSNRAIQYNSAQIAAFIEEHRKDYKFADEIAAKEKEAERLKKLSSAIRKLSENPDFAAICVSEFSDKCSIIFEVNNDKDDLFHAENAIIDQICADQQNRGIIKIDSEEKFACSKERKLLGRFLLKI